MTTGMRCTFRAFLFLCSASYVIYSYRSVTPKARLIPLTPAFLEYLREDGIVLPDDDADDQPAWTDQDSGVFSQDRSDDDDDDEALLDPSQNFRDIHLQVKDTIAELGGKVAPKLNWSAPKDATWIAATNSMECQSASDVYLLLKSSDFVTHDLEHAFDDCEDDSERPISSRDSNTINPVIPYTLVLRKWIEVNPSVEFRCFVRDRLLIGICQRDLNHFDFLSPMLASLRCRIQTFFDERLKHTFPDPNFAFDVYIPPPHKRVWLVDVNPWAPRTDPLLFSWLELLTLDTSASNSGVSKAEDAEDTTEDQAESLPLVPEFRLVKHDDPEAYSFNTPHYSAHKLPKEVVDASAAGPGPLREFADQWKEMLARRGAEQEENSDD